MLFCSCDSVLCSFWICALCFFLSTVIDRWEARSAHVWLTDEKLGPPPPPSPWIKQWQIIKCSFESLLFLKSLIRFHFLFLKTQTLRSEFRPTDGSKYLAFKRKFQVSASAAKTKRWRSRFYAVSSPPRLISTRAACSHFLSDEPMSSR